MPSKAITLWTSPAAPLALPGATQERTENQIPQPGTALLSPQPNHSSQEQALGLLSVTPPQPPSSFQLYFLDLSQMEKVGVSKGLGQRPLIILPYLQHGFKINAASLQSTTSVNWTVSCGKGIGDFEIVSVSCCWNRWNVNENEVQVNFMPFDTQQTMSETISNCRSSKN